MEVLVLAVVALALAIPTSLGGPRAADEPAAPRRPRPKRGERRLESERQAAAETRRRRLEWLARERTAAGDDPEALRRYESLAAAEEARHAERLRRLASGGDAP